MPGPVHESMVELLTEHPAWVSLLLQTLHQRSLAPTLVVKNVTLRVGEPREVHPDILLESLDPPAWALVEPQLDEDAAKLRRWVLMTAAALDRYGVMGDLVIVTPFAAVAAWAEHLIELVGAAGTRLYLKPVVVLLGEAEARALLATGRPELAFFAAWAMQSRHGTAAQQIVETALRTAETEANEALRTELVRAILNVLSAPMYARIREVFMSFQPKSEGPVLRMLREEFEAHVRATVLLRHLSKRGFVVDEPVRARVLACQDSDQLDRWLDRVLTAASLDEVFAADG